MSLAGVFEFIESFLYGIGIEAGEIQILFHEHNDARSLVDIDGRGNTDRVFQRLLRQPGDRLRYRLRADLQAVLEDSARFVIFCTLTWTKRERHTDYAASSMMFKGRKPSPDMVAWVQR
jgi:hypothetical protein